MKKLKLLEVVCQPVFVIIDDEGNLEKQVAQPVVVPASEWNNYPTGAFVESFEQLRKQVEIV